MGQVVKLDSQIEGLEQSDENEHQGGGTDTRKNVRRHMVKMLNLISDT